MYCCIYEYLFFLCAFAASQQIPGKIKIKNPVAVFVFVRMCAALSPRAPDRTSSFPKRILTKKQSKSNQTDRSTEQKQLEYLETTQSSNTTEKRRKKKKTSPKKNRPNLIQHKNWKSRKLQNTIIKLKPSYQVYHVIFYYTSPCKACGRITLMRQILTKSTNHWNQ